MRPTDGLKPGTTTIPHSEAKSPTNPIILRHISNENITTSQRQISRSLLSKHTIKVDNRGYPGQYSECPESNPKIAVSKFMLPDRSNADVTPRKGIEDLPNSMKQEHEKFRNLQSSLKLSDPQDTITISNSPRVGISADQKCEKVVSVDMKSPLHHAWAIDGDDSAKESRGGGGNGKRDVTTVKQVSNNKLPRRPLSAFLRRSSSKTGMSLGPSIPKSISFDRLPSVLQTFSPSCSLPANSRLMSTVRSHDEGHESRRKKDELWSLFKNLEADFYRFQSRPTSSRTGIIRSSLLQFLRTHADHPSNMNLKPDDLDRRIDILNKWWAGMLEMLNGRNGESVSGNDRSVILDAVTAIMIRPEWDSAMPLGSLRHEKTLKSALVSRSTTSLTSNESDFLTESILHNTRNTFSQNLLAQMTFVIEKMSARNVAPSVVTFCGKTIAYAFFYCDGVAEILVRLWEIRSETLRRILAEYNVQRFNKLQSSSEDVNSRYPSCLHALAFKSLPQTMRYLRSQPQLPINTAYIPWHGPWVKRWVGKETDLFFAFAKTFHTLTCRSLPDGHNHEDMITAPCYILVQAQILSVLDANLQYDSNPLSVDYVKGHSSMTFDDILRKPDATAAILPHPASSGNRSMAENRLIILLRDCLSRASSTDERGRRVFADSFEKVLKATTKRTSLYDQNACFVLCDFMEESLAILARYYQSSDSVSADVDWPFWLDVLKRMGKSENTMTEIRLYAFLYSLWGTITSGETMKRNVCLEWLLNEDVFQNQFNHWCPMVRAYFMRLLCWRVARCNGRVTNLDRTILETLSARLDGAWSVFLALKEHATTCQTLTPSTAPCSPAPGRCLLIVRDDLQSATSGMFLSFDSLLSEPSRTQATAYERYGSLSAMRQTDLSAQLNRSNGKGKRQWSSLRSILPFTGSSGNRPRAPSTHIDSSDGSEPPKRQQLEEKISFQAGHNNQIAFQAETNYNDEPQHMSTSSYDSHSFKFSLEWNNRERKTIERDKSLDPPKLPAIAQSLTRPTKTIPLDSIPITKVTKLSKYTGRALSEWDLIVTECQNFFERRKKEGVPTVHNVETPSLGVEILRKI